MSVDNKQEVKSSLDNSVWTTTYAAMQQQKRAAMPRYKINVKPVLAPSGSWMGVATLFMAGVNKQNIETDCDYDKPHDAINAAYAKAERIVNQKCHRLSA